MGKGLVAFVGLIYVGVAIDQYFKGNIGTALTFLGYAFSNVGLFMVVA